VTRIQSLILAFVVTVFVGELIVYCFVRIVRWLSNDRERYPHAVPPWIVGVFERTMAFFLFLFAIEAAGTVLIAWMAAKLAANWQRRELTESERKSHWIRTRTFTALMAGVLSLAIGTAGGSASRCLLPLDKLPGYCAFLKPERIIESLKATTVLPSSP
jgi:hypothetical protein